MIAESRSGDPNNVVMVGAHLDSVQRGPGIQDNGSGSAAILETAIQMAKVNPRNRLRFAWWGAEEAGLVGSTAYVNGLSQAEKDRIALYLNFDMIGSPNHVFFVYDGDDSDVTGAPAGPGGSAQIEKVFENFYNERSIPFKAQISAAAPTTARSSRSAFPQAGCSPALKASRRPQRRPPGAAPPAPSTTRAITWRVTTTPTSTSPRSTSIPTRWRIRRCSSR